VECRRRRSCLQLSRQPIDETGAVVGGPGTLALALAHWQVKNNQVSLAQSEVEGGSRLLFPYLSGANLAQPVDQGQGLI
jgi:hypothetical protein